MSELKIGGIYKHYKTGNNYKVICLAKHSESLDDLVIYETLYDNPRSKFWARPAAMFLEEVEKDGVKQPRFKLVE